MHKLTHLIFSFVLFSIISADPICTLGYTMVNNKCWKLFTKHENQTTADERCRENGGGILVTMKNAIDNRALLTVLNGTGIHRLWMGMTCRESSVSWCQWADKTDVQYNSFSSGYPNSQVGKCVYYNSYGDLTGQWTSEPCEEKLPFVCEILSSTPEIVGSDCYSQYNNFCYTRVRDKLSFKSAQQNCVLKNSSLISIHSYLENRYITTLFNIDGSVWLGGQITPYDTLEWTDMTPYDYSNLKHVGNGTCVSIGLVKYTNAMDWSTGNCESTYPSICKRPLTI